MIRNLPIILALAAIGLGCSEQPSKETAGTGAGAAIGGVVGALLGREIGRRTDEQDRQNAHRL